MATLATRPAAPPHAVEPAPRAAARWETWLRRNWPLLALSVGAIAVTLVSRFAIHPAFSWNRDEVTYLWQADLLRSGNIVGSNRGQPLFFWPWLAGLRDGQYFSQYTIGWPALLAAFDWALGSATFALAVGAVGAVLGTYVFTRELTADRPLALVAAAVMLASPLLVVQSGTYLAYLFSLGLGLFFGAALLAGLRRDLPGLLAVAALLLGWILLTRPFDAVLWAIPLMGYALVVHRGRWRLLGRAALWFGLAFLPFVALMLLYNRRVTGSFTQFPITAKDPLDTFGFGQRRLMPEFEPFDYTVGRVLRSFARNVRVTPPFLLGWWLGAAVAVVGLWLRRRDRTTIALVALAASFPIGYLYFWGNLLSSRAAGLSGPIYYVPAYAPLAVLIATVIIAAWRRRAVAGIALCVALVIATVPTLWDKVSVNHRISAAQEPWKHATRSLREPALVVVEFSGPYLMHLDPYSRNGAELDDHVLYAADRSPRNLDVITGNRQRAPYLLRTTDPRWGDPVGYHDATVPDVWLVPLSLVSGRTATLRVRVVNTGGGPAVVTYLHVSRTGVSQSRPGLPYDQQRVLATDARRGDTFELEWTLAPDGGDVTLTQPEGTITVGVASGATPEAALAGRQSLVELTYRLDPASGTVELLYPGRPYTARYLRADGDRLLRLLPVKDDAALDVQLTTSR